MPLEMISCPHCGTQNSANKRVCYHCQQQLKAEEPAVQRRALRPKSLPAIQVPQRALQQTTQAGEAAKVAVPAAKPAEKPARRAPSFSTGASLRQRVQFYRQMHGLLRSGIPLGLSLNYVENSIARHLRPVMRAMAEEVQKGNRFSEQMQQFPSLFPEWECSVVKAAELSGTLPHAMDSIASTLELEMDLRQRVSSHTLHLKATAVVFILVLMVVTGVGGAAGGTGNIMAVFNFLIASILRTAGIVFAVLIGIRLWHIYARTRKGGNIAYAISSRVPIVGPLMKNMMRLRFIRVLEALWQAGVGPLEALETAAHASGSRYVMNKVGENKAKLGEGGTLSDVLEATRILPQEGMYLVRAGENSGTIPEALAKVAEYLELDIKSQVKTLPMKIQLIFYAVIVPAVLALLIWFYTGYFNTILNQF